MAARAAELRMWDITNAGTAGPNRTDPTGHRRDRCPLQLAPSSSRWASASSVPRWFSSRSCSLQRCCWRTARSPPRRRKRRRPPEPRPRAIDHGWSEASTKGRRRWFHGDRPRLEREQHGPDRHGRRLHGGPRLRAADPRSFSGPARTARSSARSSEHRAVARTVPTTLQHYGAVPQGAAPPVSFPGPSRRSGRPPCDNRRRCAATTASTTLPRASAGSTAAG